MKIFLTSIVISSILALWAKWYDESHYTNVRYESLNDGWGGIIRCFNYSQRARKIATTVRYISAGIMFFGFLYLIWSFN